MDEMMKILGRDKVLDGNQREVRNFTKMVRK